MRISKKARHVLNQIRCSPKGAYADLLLGADAGILRSLEKKGLIFTSYGSWSGEVVYHAVPTDDT